MSTEQARAFAAFRASRHSASGASRICGSRRHDEVPCGVGFQPAMPRSIGAFFQVRTGCEECPDESGHGRLESPRHRQQENAMTFRTRLLLVFTLAVVAAVGLVEVLVVGNTRQTFERIESQRVDVLTRQFRKEFERRAGEIERAVAAIANSESMVEIALAPDPAVWYREAEKLAASHRLDLLELVAGDATIVSSAQWPARFGYKEEWLASGNWKQRGALLRQVELREGMTL